MSIFTFKLQSAMEYLMTYGWSILLIAIVLAAVFELGVFNNNPISSSNTCIAQSGFLCSKPILNTTGSLNVTFGQAFGTTYTLTGVACVNSTASPPSTFTYINAVKFYSGETAPLNFKCPLSSNAIGSGFSGELWIQYNTATFSGEAAKVGLVDAKVSTGSAIGSGSVFVNYDVPITLTNLQSTSTGSNFQQMLSINSNQYSSYINGNWMNVEFTTGNALAGSPGTTLQAWVESGASNTATNTVVWVLLPNGIPAQSSTTIYMNFMAGNVMSASGPTGEAPQLSPSYAQYDNGAGVFSFYDDFAGNTLNPMWTKSTSGSASLTVNNGLVIVSGASGTYADIFAPYVPSLTGVVSDIYVIATEYTAVSEGFTYGQTSSIDSQNTYSQITEPSGTYGIAKLVSGTSTRIVTGSSGSPTGGQLSTLTWSSHTLSINDAGLTGSATDSTFSLSQMAQIVIRGTEIGSPSATTSVYYIDVRAYPPNDVLATQSTGVSIPSQIIHYVPITLTNSQSSATSSNFQANVVFSAGAYQAYESNTLQNIEFFYANGTIVPSWMEGNTLNEQQTANVYTSNTIMYWLNIAPQIPATGGSLTVYMGFAPTGTNLLNSATTGEAPQLSPSYAEYDNGADVFNFYDNFAGNTLNAALWSKITPISPSATVSVSNSLTITGNGGGARSGVVTNSQFTAPSVSDVYITSNIADGSGGQFISTWYQDTTDWMEAGVGETSDGFAVWKYVSGTFTDLYDTSYTTSPLILSFSKSSNNYQSTVDYNSPSSGTYSVSYTGANYLFLYVYGGEAGAIQYARVRDYPPNGVPPTVSFGTFT